MKLTVRLSTAIALSCVGWALGVAETAFADETGMVPVVVRTPIVEPTVEVGPSPHPALVMGIFDVGSAGVLTAVGFIVGPTTFDNGWEKASSLIGAGVGMGALGTAAIVHGKMDTQRRIKSPVEAAFGWGFTTLAAGGAGAGIGLAIGGDRDGKVFGGVMAASSLIFLAPGIPLIVDGEATDRTPPPVVPVVAPSWYDANANARWLQQQQQPTEMNSPAMVGIGATCIGIGSLGAVAGLATMGVGSTFAESGNSTLLGLGGGVLGGGLVLALAVGTPLVVVGARREPVAPTFSVGPGGVGLQGSF